MTSQDTVPKPSAQAQAAEEAIDWTIRERNGRPALFWDGEYCRVATEPETALWAQLEAAEKRERLALERAAATAETYAGPVPYAHDIAAAIRSLAEESK